MLRKLLTVTVCMLPATASLQAQDVAPVVDLKLEDQFERGTATSAFRGHVLVLLYGDRSGQKANSGLGELLHTHYHPTAKGMSAAQAQRAPVIPVEGATPTNPGPNVFVVPVACIGKVPGAVRSLIRSQFRSGSPDVPVWLDFQDKMKDSYGLESGKTNMLILDGKGRLRLRVTGNLSEADIGRVVGTIDRLRKEATR